MNTLLDKIKNKSIEYGSIPFWSWNDRLDEKRLIAQIQDMHDINMNGFFMHARFGLETEYMSKEWFDAIRASVNEAKRLNMQAWSYDENGWPSGFAGGELLKDKRNWSVYLEFSVKQNYDPQALAVYVKKEGIPQRIIAPLNNVDQVEYLTVYTKFDDSYVDIMDADITDRFIESTYKRYKDELKDDFGKAMPGFFTDEPQYYRRYTTWSLKMPYEFEQAYGYDVLDGLCALFMDYEGAEEFRYDYWLLCHKLYINNFIKRVYEWCEQNGCMVTGHSVEENTLHGQMWCSGGVMPFYEYQHIPGIDYLTRNVRNDIPAKQVGSVAAQLGRKKVLSEMYAACGWDVTPVELKYIAEFQYASGVNLMCQHLYPLSERGQRKRDYPAHYSEHLPWHEKMKQFNEYFNRLGYILSRGQEQVNVLCIHPMHSAYLKYKRKEDYLSVDQLNEAFYEITNLLSQNQIAYHYGDEILMAKYGKVKNDKLCIGLCEYDHVVLPLMYTLDTATVNLLKEYIANGGKIYIHDEKPERIDGRISDMSWLEQNISFDRIKNSSFTTFQKNGKQVPEIRCMIRNTEYGTVYYMLNLSYERLDNVQVEFKNKENIRMLDLTDLSIKELPDNEKITLNFDPVESFILIQNETSCSYPEFKQARKGVMDIGNVFRFSEKPENAIPLDYAEISYDGINFEKSRPIPLVRDMLLQKRYRGALWLRYSFDVEKIPKKISVAIEPMNRKNISFNDKPLSLDENAYWFDESFKTADITRYLKKGKNSVVVEIDYHQNDYVYHVLYDDVSESLRNCLNFDTEIENVSLFGNFYVETDKNKFITEHRNSMSYDGAFSITVQKETINFTDAVKDGYPFFAGCMKLETKYIYDGSDNTMLVLNGRYSVADIFANENFVGTCMFKNHIDLSGFLVKGQNTIRIEVYNSNRNLMGPHHAIDPEPYSVGPHVFSFEGKWVNEQCSSYLDRYAFVRFGFEK